MTRKQLLIIAGGAVAILVVLIIYGIIIRPPEPKKPAHLEIWGVYDEPEVFQNIISEYTKQNKHISIEYKKKTFADYEEELINAFASDKEPDIWLMHNTWLPKHRDKIKEVPTEFFPFTVFKQTFVDVVEKDLSENNKIYGLPLYVDTLALYYNKDFFNTAGITGPPETWDELIEDLDKLIKKNQWGQIERAGIALGTAENINRSTDILALLMLQNGTKMVSDDRKSVAFDEGVNLEGKMYYPGEEALRFYTEFANPSKRSYTWNKQMSYSIDAFIEGKTAMMINYSHHIPTIKSKAPYLNFGIAPMSQIKGREFDINYANYWAFAVSKDTKVPEEAWKFILYLVNKENSQKYLEKTKRPTARRDLIDWQENDLELGIFAKQSLTARNWYQIDDKKIETILAEAIDSVVLSRASISKAIDTAANQINLLMK